MPVKRTFWIGLTAVMTLAAAALPSSGRTADVSVEVTLDRDTIGLDEQAVLQVVVSGSDQSLPPPNMPSLPMFEVYSQGRSSNLRVVNGKISASVTYRYMLLPLKPGTYPIDQIAVVHNNKRYLGNRLELTVLDQGAAAAPQLERGAEDQSGRSRDYFMEAVVDKQSPYVNEQVTLTLKFYTAVQYYGSPELAEPATTGFWTEVLGNKAPYYQKISNRTYKVIERTYALFPTQTGELTIGGASIRFNIARTDRRFRDPFDMFGDFFGGGQEVSVRSAPITIDVRPLPEQGRPADFTGTIGKFKISVAADKHEVEINQPVTLTIRISGTGNIKSVAEPVIPQLEDFRVYRASSSENVSKLNDRLGGTKVFEEVFIPRRPGTLEIPALSFSYFDPEQGQYHVLNTRATRLKVIKPEGYAASPDVPYPVPDLTIGSQARDIRYIKEKLGTPVPVGRLLLLTPIYLMVNGVPVLALVTMLLIRRHRQRMATDVGYARSRKAGKLARRRLSRARSMARVDQARGFYAEIYTALTSYVADKYNVSPHGLTSERIRELLQTRAADESLVPDVTDVLNQCDFARFAPAAVTQEEISAALKRSEEIIIRIEGVKLG